MLSRLLSAAAGLALLPLLARADDPEVSVTRLQYRPAALWYFKDSPIILTLDTNGRTVSRSEDEGKTWEQVTGVDDATRLYIHPHNNEMAFAIGSTQKHWVSYNRGASWQEFTTPREASVLGDVLKFHATNPEWILFQGVMCEESGGGWWGGSKSCWDETYYTTDAFRTEPELLLKQTSQCLFARGTKDFEDAPEKLVFCIAFDPNTTPSDGVYSFKDSRLYSSEDWFKTPKYVDLGIGKKAKGVVGLGVVSKFMIVALKVPDEHASATGNGDPM